MKLKIFILIFIILSLLYLINNILKNKENFKIYHTAPFNSIKTNCEKYFSKNFKNQKHIASRSAFVTNPILLSGVCGSNNRGSNKPLYILKNKKNNKVYYGCNETVDKSLNWHYNKHKFPSFESMKLTKKLSNSITTNSTIRSDLILFIASDNDVTIINQNKYLPCKNYSSNTKGINQACYNYIWKRSGCGTGTLGYPPANASWQKNQTLNGLIQDSWLWSTMTDSNHRNGCYGSKNKKYNMTKSANFNINSNVIGTYKSNNFGIFVIKNFRNNRQILLNIKNNKNKIGGISFSYLYAGQLYVLNNNNNKQSVNSFNSQNYTVSNSSGFISSNNISSYTNPIPTLPSFMNNWLSIPSSKEVNISLNSAVKNNIDMNILTIYIIINGKGTIKINNDTVYNYDQKNKLINFNSNNIILGDKITVNINGDNINRDSLVLSIAYLYNGNLFVLNDLKAIGDKKEIINNSNILDYECKGINKQLVDNNSIKNNTIKVPFFMTGWLTSSYRNNNFVFTTKIGVDM